MTNKYSKLTPSMIINLAGPHTWPASIFPVLLAICACAVTQKSVSVSLSITLLLISILLQSATNVLNDYFDFKKGADTESDNLEPSDSVLVYNNVNPGSVKAVAIVFIVISLLLGLYCIYASGPFCLLIAGIGILAMLLYSGGLLPISYLPLGEIVSGFVMGGLITYASFNVLTDDVSPFILIVSIPLIINIAMIMLTNNASDIEKDEVAGRKTLPVLLGRKKTRILYSASLVASYVSILVICIVFYRNALLLYPFLLVLTLPMAMRLFATDLGPDSRISNMSQICGFNIASGSAYCLMILFSGTPILF